MRNRSVRRLLPEVHYPNVHVQKPVRLIQLFNYLVQLLLEQLYLLIITGQDY
jgi:hypothetical protein